MNNPFNTPCSNPVVNLENIWDDTRNHFTTLDLNTICFTKGTNIEISRIHKKCKCFKNYFGDDCGIPSYIWKTGNNAKLLPNIVRRRKLPRRIIYALPVNHEFDLFETRMAMHSDVVDVFILHESNNTNSGHLKPRLFFNKFRNEGWFRDVYHKFIYIFQDTFPEEGKSNGQIADAFMRKHLGQTAFNHRLNGAKDDDMFIYNDGDELIRPEVITFLKLYEGFTDPIGFKYRWAIFGFFWTIIESKFGEVRNFETAAMTVGFFRDFYKYDASVIKGSEFEKDNELNVALKKSYTEKGKRIKLFKCAEDAGWHCSYCFKPEGVRKKLLDAPVSDWPRWGDDPVKSNATYIRNLIRNGQFFDSRYFRGSTSNVLTLETDPEIAPQYMLQNLDKFKYLIINEYT